MELNLCPGCDAFVGRDWDVCRTCGQVLTLDGSYQDESDRPLPDEVAATNRTPETPAHLEELSELDVPGPPEPLVGYESSPTSEPSTQFYWPAAESSAPLDPPTQYEPPTAAETPAPLDPPTQYEPLAVAESSAQFEMPASPQTPTATESSAQFEMPASPQTPAAPGETLDPLETPGPSWQFSWDGPSKPADQEIPAPLSQPSAQTPVEQLTDWTPAQSSATPATEAIDAGASSSEWIGTTLTSSGGRQPVRALLTVMTIVVVVVVAVLVAFSLVTKARDKTPASTTTTTTAPANTAADWTTYFDPAGRFRVDLPAAPNVSAEKINGLDANVAQIDTTDGRSTIVITAMALPAGADWSKNDQALHDALQGSATSAGAKVKSAVVTTVGSHRELNAHLESKDAVYDARYFSEGGTLFIMLIATHQQDGDPSTFSRVTDSFRSLDP